MRQRLPGRAPLPQPQLAHAHPLAGPPAFKRYEDGLLGVFALGEFGPDGDLGEPGEPHPAIAATVTKTTHPQSRPRAASKDTEVNRRWGARNTLAVDCGTEA